MFFTREDSSPVVESIEGTLTKIQPTPPNSIGAVFGE
jgi:hypothetical protein